MNTLEPLVSVPVITYNSSKTVVETLDSIYNQSYSNLELIVSDDCSTDNTVEICREWIAVHGCRFIRTELLTVDRNTGVSANMNRAEAACQGEWVKPIAGDDILMPDCIETYVDYVSKHSDAIYVFSKVETFGGEEDRRKVIESQYLYEFFNWPIERQYDFLTLERNCIPAATSFYNRNRIMKLGVKNDERIPLLDDWPRWINLLKKGVRFCFIDKVLVKYRVGESAISTRKDLSVEYKKSLALNYIYYGFPNDYRKRDKKMAILKYLRLQRFVHDNALLWRIVVKLYKFLFSIE